MAITYIHPSITSNIIDNSFSYVTADGTTKLFAVITSEKGEDNKIRQISSVSEFEFNYGEPNIKKYGQVSYNIINWLNAGGIVYVLRVLPEDAGYANAIVNIQTKKGTKKVLNNNGTLVEIPDITIRPTVTATNVNNTSVSSLEIDELRKAINDTIDGFKNNMLFAVIPKGRGIGYNDLGFRISLLSNFDNTYDFRLYNFEVTKTNKNGSIDTIQGPFIVSLDPDAVSISGESLFIKSVIDKYCDYVSIIFNEDNYDKLGEIINPNVNPARIDFFNGVTRIIEDNPETYYDPITEQDEDIHLYLRKYDSDGEWTGEYNIIDADDEIEAEIVNYDNTYRNNIYKREKQTSDDLKVALSKLKKSTSGNNAIQSYLSEDADYIQNNTDLDAEKSELDEKFNAICSDTNDTTYKEFRSALDSVGKLITKDVDTVYKLYDFTKINGSNETSIALRTSLSSIENQIYSVNNVNIKLSSKTSAIDKIIDALNKAKITELLVSEEVDFVKSSIDSFNSIYDLLNDSRVGNFTSDLANQINDNIISLEDLYDEITTPYISEEDYDLALNGDQDNDGAYDYIDKIAKDMKTLIKYVNAEITYDNYNNVISAIDDCKSNIMSLYDDMNNNINNESIAVNDVVAIIDTQEAKVSEALQDTYNLKLQNYDNNVKLRFGSDGAFNEKSYTSAEVERYIVKGYLGTIDNSLLDKFVYPIDVILDANYSVNIKNAIITLTTEIRNDFVAMLDTKCQANAEQAIAFRKSSLGISNFRVSIWGQDFIVNDSAYTGHNMQVTTPYFLASKIPVNDNQFGVHWNFVGPRRGIISGFESISYLPNPEWKEQLYQARINYVEQDLNSTRLGSQLTSQVQVSALSNVNNVRALLRIQREVEKLMADYQFEYNDSVTLAAANSALGGYLTQWTANRCCTSISGSVYASAYDREQKLVRVKVEMVFNSIIERIAIDFIINK